MRRVRDSLKLALVGIAMSGVMVACGGGDDDGGNGGIEPPDTTDNGGTVDVSSVSGDLAEGFEFVGNLPRVRLGAPPRPGAAAAQDVQADSVFAGTPRANGNISFEGPGEPIATDANSYELPEVPAGRKRLIVAAVQQEIVDGEKPHIGRVLVYARSDPGGSITNEPMTYETTVEGGVAMGVMLGEHTAPVALINNTQIGLTHRFTPETGRAAASSRAQLDALVPAYKDGQRGFVRSIEQLGVSYADSLAINTALREQAGQPYAEARAGGMGMDEAHEQFIDDALSVYQSELGNERVLSIAWGMFGTIYDNRLVNNGEIAEATRMEAAQNLLDISVHASKALVESASAPDAAKTAVSDALDSMLSDAMAATSMSEFMTAVSDGRAAAVTALEDAMGTDFDESAANLKASLDLSQNPQTMAFGLQENYIAPLESAVSDEGARDLLIAIWGGPGYTGGSM